MLILAALVVDGDTVTVIEDMVKEAYRKTKACRLLTPSPVLISRPCMKVAIVATTGPVSACMVRRGRSWWISSRSD